MFYVYSLCFFFLFLCFFIFFFPFFNLSFFLFDFSFLSLKLSFFLSNLLFSFVLLVISLSVLLYSCYYMNGELNFFYYIFVLLIFIFSMFLLLFGNSIFGMLIGWDLLGITSFFLVLFYNNWDSCSGAMNTIMTNRLGDFFFFLFFSLAFFNCYFFFSYSYVVYSVFFFLILVSFTKSAQFPFSGWLPKAMSAPTPVSSLVHSSTLVTAGLVVLFNFNMVIMTKDMMIFFFIFGLFTMFFSSVLALFESDLKKVVALSTLSQMGFSFFVLGIGLNFLGLVHLLSHALFKSCLFMQIGYIIYCSMGQQDGRSYSNVGNLPLFMQLQVLCSLFCLCGLFFVSGGVSKDLVLGFFFSNSFCFFSSLFFFVSVFLTFCYSYRLWCSFFNSFCSSFIYYSGSLIFNFLSVFLFFFSVFFVWWINFNFFCIPVFFLYFDFWFFYFFLIMFFFFFCFCFNFVFDFVRYKFVFDFIPSFIVRFLPNLKFFDMFLNSLNFKFFGFFSVLSLDFSFMFKFFFNPVIFFVFFMFIFL
uniref:NADH:ubiquinone reductase (H(+)-translocating) n=1 Tax=Strongyloides cebus TaxID=174719 RepID=A0A977NVH0_9BILA|nr:NADH dehydrogenase subunit 5 [Strongyloides cebus]UWK23995.1 NADH dehydrogenase subunit 5 [Strongyloides cebus]